MRWAKQQRAKSRRKRDFLRLRQPQSLLSNYMPWNDPKWSHMWYLVSIYFVINCYLEVVCESVIVVVLLYHRIPYGLSFKVTPLHSNLCFIDLGFLAFFVN